MRGLLKPGGVDELARDPAYFQHDESEAERLLLEGKKILDLPSEMSVILIGVFNMEKEF